MIPFKDENPTERFPFVTIGLIVLNCLVYLYELSLGDRLVQFFYTFGAVPSELIRLHSPHTLFSSMFIHGGILHLAGNMLYLWIFGNNIEDRLGHTRFLVFYLLSGIVAAYGHAISAPSSKIPMVGASGAVSSILGAYMLLYPGARVHTLVFLGFFVQVVRVPAVLIIGFWVVIQFLNALMSKTLGGGPSVAWFAHIGGFLFGFLSIKIWLPRAKRRP